MVRRASQRRPIGIGSRELRDQVEGRAKRNLKFKVQDLQAMGRVHSITGGISGVNEDKRLERKHEADVPCSRKLLRTELWGKGVDGKIGSPYFALGHGKGILEPPVKPIRAQKLRVNCVTEEVVTL